MDCEESSSSASQLGADMYDLAVERGSNTDIIVSILRYSCLLSLSMRLSDDV